MRRQQAVFSSMGRACSHLGMQGEKVASSFPFLGCRKDSQDLKGKDRWTGDLAAFISL